MIEISEHSSLHNLVWKVMFTGYKNKIILFAHFFRQLNSSCLHGVSMCLTVYPCSIMFDKNL